MGRTRDVSRIITTPPNIYATDDEVVLKTIIDAKGDLIAGTADNTVNRLAAGTNGQVLVAASGETTGLKWNDPGTVGGLVHIETRTVTAVSAESFDNVFSSDYDNYKIILNISNTATTNLTLRLRNGGSDRTGSVYKYIKQEAVPNTTTTSSASTQSSFLINAIASAQHNLIGEIFTPFDAGKRAGFNFLVNQNTSLVAAVSALTIGGYTTSDSNDGFSLASSSGTISGQISIFGYAKA